MLKNKKTRNTVIFILFILILALGLLIYQRVLQNKMGDCVVISLDGKEVKRIDLNKERTFKVESPYGGYNIVEIKDHGVSVKESDCENQICVSQGIIHESYELIVCLPHTLVITIEKK